MGFNVKIIESNYTEAIKNGIRNAKAEVEVIRENLDILGNEVSKSIIESYFLDVQKYITPMGVEHSGLHLMNKKIIVVSTKDDYEYFGNGIAELFNYVKRGYMDFDGKRGFEALTCPFRTIDLPDEDGVYAVVIAKSVLATGCTAITLAKKAVEKYNPEVLVIASIFYSNEGIDELKRKLGNVSIFVVGEADGLTNDGMLIPGLGDLDKRIYCGRV